MKELSMTGTPFERAARSSWLVGAWSETPTGKSGCSWKRKIESELAGNVYAKSVDTPVNLAVAGTTFFGWAREFSSSGLAEVRTVAAAWGTRPRAAFRRSSVVAGDPVTLTALTIIWPL